MTVKTEIKKMDLKSIKGIGDKSAALFEKLGVYSVEDLLEFYPRAYDCYNEPEGICNTDAGTVIAVKGKIASSPQMAFRNRFKILSAVIRDEEGTAFKAVWYNMPFLKGKLKTGAVYIFRGKISYKGQNIIMEQPDIYSIGEYDKIVNMMQPVYRLTKGLSNKLVTKAVRSAINEYMDDNDYLPGEILKKYDLINHKEALINIHFPTGKEDRDGARKRLAFDEFFKFIMVLRQFKERNNGQSNEFVISRNELTDKFIKTLPFSLTEAQTKVLAEIEKDMSSKRTMNRLIQGDVGSGKTIVALIAMIDTALAGYQAIMMAPTEVLARQHYEYIKKTVSDNNLPFEVAVLTGSMGAAARREESGKIKSGKAKIIVGTHALIQDKAEYDNVALVITDEQHRFGVKQRETLAFKGKNPHILVMSATPIPRTLAIILYGDLDISVMNGMPSERLPIKNCVVGTDYRPNAYRFIENEVKAGHQAYVICAMVEESENVEAENVVEYTEKLRKAMSKDIRIEYLHGQMKGTEKNAIMEKYAAGETDVLVSTTVIEVGVNVPNATVMMVEDAQRFGLAALHQLRGRVGRGSAQSYCIFVNTSKSKSATQRLDILNKSNDGFYIASQDMKLRGPGDFFGIRQSGEMDFNIADIYTDAEILKNASDAADAIENGDIIIKADEADRFDMEISKCYKKANDKINL
ncbi:MAG: ATP-dependent DNA helicase RecG [Lachnospiraceae bacterium]|nr:ATP-dependent DNA helicase RecG [Lachnospiraceae bacterium]